MHRSDSGSSKGSEGMAGSDGLGGMQLGADYTPVPTPAMSPAQVQQLRRAAAARGQFGYCGPMGAAAEEGEGGGVEPEADDGQGVR